MVTPISSRLHQLPCQPVCPRDSRRSNPPCSRVFNRLLSQLCSPVCSQAVFRPCSQLLCRVASRRASPPRYLRSSPLPSPHRNQAPSHLKGLLNSLLLSHQACPAHSLFRCPRISLRVSQVRSHLSSRCQCRLGYQRCSPAVSLRANLLPSRRGSLARNLRPNPQRSHPLPHPVGFHLEYPRIRLRHSPRCNRPVSPLLSPLWSPPRSHLYARQGNPRLLPAVSLRLNHLLCQPRCPHVNHPLSPRESRPRSQVRDRPVRRVHVHRRSPRANLLPVHPGSPLSRPLTIRLPSQAASPPSGPQ